MTGGDIPFTPCVPRGFHPLFLGTPLLCSSVPSLCLRDMRHWGLLPGRNSQPSFDLVLWHRRQTNHEVPCHLITFSHFFYYFVESSFVFFSFLCFKQPPDVGREGIVVFVEKQSNRCEGPESHGLDQNVGPHPESTSVCCPSNPTYHQNERSMSQTPSLSGTVHA